MRNHRTIYKDASVEHIISKSRFIGYACPVQTENEAILFIEKIKKKHWDATHNVPVYVLGETFSVQRYSDDGELSGTAGVPILDMLKKEGITNACVVVTRYFGGVKLGTGGLVRAYTETAKLALEEAWIVERQLVCEVELSFEYHHHGKIQNYLLHHEGIIIRDTQFSDTVSISIYYEPSIEIEVLNQLIEMTANQIEIHKKEDCYITVKDGKVLETNFYDSPTNLDMKY